MHNFPNHYSRNRYNKPLPSSLYNIEKIGYIKYEGFKARYHQNNQWGGENVKFVHEDGRREIVFYSNEVVNNTYEDVGTYNFGDSGVSHYDLDVAPYLLLGNSLYDTTTLMQRLRLAVQAE